MVGHVKTGFLQKMEKEIKVQAGQGLGMITFERHSALNALSLEMIREMDTALSDWTDNENIKAILVTGSGGKAFCAGGDVLAVYKHGLSFKAGLCPIQIPILFFKEEYRLNHFIHSYKKPYIAYLNGITMGGGFGVSAPGELMITSEKTLFAMPEVHIGLFPDIGSMYYLHKLNGNLGLYLALTGKRLKAKEMHVFGLATYHFPTSKYMDFRKALSEFCKSQSHLNDIEGFLSSWHEDPEGEDTLSVHFEEIHDIFSRPALSAIIAALKENKTEWAKEALDSITRASPTSLEIVMKQWERIKDKSYKQVLELDFQIVQNVLKKDDFYIGVREQLIQKTRQPKWAPLIPASTLLEPSTTTLFEN